MGLGSPIAPVDTRSCPSSEASFLHNINEELIELYKYLEKHQVSAHDMFYHSDKQDFKKSVHFQFPHLLMI
jgi:hypothetical protein